jgi:hypothetical protein
MDTSPAEKWLNRKPDLSKVHNFGQQVYSKIVKPLKKLDERSEEATFVGYSTNGYRLWIPKKKQIFISRDVKFTDTYPESDEKQENEKNFTLDIYLEEEDNQNSNRQQENQERAGN